MPSRTCFPSPTRLISGYHRRMWSLLFETDLCVTNSSRARGPSALQRGRASTVHLPYPEEFVKPHCLTSSKFRFGSHELLYNIL